LNNISFGRRLSDLRKVAGLSEESFAFKCGLTVDTFELLREVKKSPTRNTIEKITIALNITIQELFDGI